ncbi:MAG: esterase-like activity of phytase family protein, partial [Actinomycetia bacterium]|nr:esterase-like activity of phytase family protein [Actinomycetes bacterium]
NNAIVVVDLPSGKVETSFSAGTVAVDGVDTADDGRVDLSESLEAAPREPDAITWVDDTHVATANEGDWHGGTRGWSVFDTTDGSVAWDSGARLERRAAAYGLIDDSRSDDKGIEPEGIAFGRFRGTPYAFVGSERSNFVAVYDLSDPTRPKFEQILPTTNGPEGLLPIPRRNLLAVSSEEDDAEDGVRASVGMYRLGHRDAHFPTVVSARRVGGRPIGWGALSALSTSRERGTLYAASDSAYSMGRIYTLDVARGAARINNALTITSGGEPAKVDIEGLFARPRGGFWVASEGETGAENALLRVTRRGRILRTVHLPKRITRHMGKWGLEGVTATRGRSGRERVYVALQRPLWKHPDRQTGPRDGKRIVRIGRYMVRSGKWDWFGYRLSRSPGDSWTGLSEITAIDRNSVAVIERDNRVGTDAKIKRIYSVDVPWRQPGEITRVKKSLAYDALPDLRATRGWTQEKLEGLAIGRGGQVYAVTDNDALDDATGETVFLRLGRKSRVFG